MLIISKIVSKLVEQVNDKTKNTNSEQYRTIVSENSITLNCMGEMCRLVICFINK